MPDERAGRCPHGAAAVSLPFRVQQPLLSTRLALRADSNANKPAHCSVDSLQISDYALERMTQCALFRSSARVALNVFAEPGKTGRSSGGMSTRSKYPLTGRPLKSHNQRQIAPIRNQGNRSTFPCQDLAGSDSAGFPRWVRWLTGCIGQHDASGWGAVASVTQVLGSCPYSCWRETPTESAVRVGSFWIMRAARWASPARGRAYIHDASGVKPRV